MNDRLSWLGYGKMATQAMSNIDIFSIILGYLKHITSTGMFETHYSTSMYETHYSTGMYETHYSTGVYETHYIY